jgi:hypothetical protein
VTHVFESGGLSAGSHDLLVWRRRARQWTAVTHAAGLLLPGVLMFTTEGPAAPVGAGQSNVTVAWWNLVLTGALCATQFAAVAVWRWCALELRAAGWRSQGTPACRPERAGRRVLRACAGLLILAVWTAEAGYAAQGVTSVRSGGYYEPASGFMMGTLVLALALGLVAVITGGLALLAAALSRPMVRRAPSMAAAFAAAYSAPQQLAVLERQRRRMTRFIVCGILLVAVDVAVVVWAAVTGHWESRLTYSAPVWLSTSVVYTIRAVKARNMLRQAELRLSAPRIPSQVQPTPRSQQRALRPALTHGDEVSPAARGQARRVRTGWTSTFR